MLSTLADAFFASRVSASSIDMADQSVHQVMSPTNARHFKGERLKGSENYATWAFMFTSYLQGRDAENLLSDENAKSPHSKQVFAELVSAVDPSVIIEIMGTTTGLKLGKL